jgi:hypothetical protein
MDVVEESHCFLNSRSFQTVEVCFKLIGGKYRLRCRIRKMMRDMEE